MYLQVVLTFVLVVLTFVYKLLVVGARCLCVTICLQVVTRVYNVLQGHVSTRSEMTYHHVRKSRSEMTWSTTIPPQKLG